MLLNRIVGSGHGSRLSLAVAPAETHSKPLRDKCPQLCKLEALPRCSLLAVCSPIFTTAKPTCVNGSTWDHPVLGRMSGSQHQAAALILCNLARSLFQYCINLHACPSGGEQHNPFQLLSTGARVRGLQLYVVCADTPPQWSGPSSSLVFMHCPCLARRRQKTTGPGRWNGIHSTLAAMLREPILDVGDARRSAHLHSSRKEEKGRRPTPASNAQSGPVFTS